MYVVSWITIIVLVHLWTLFWTFVKDSITEQYEKFKLAYDIVFASSEHPPDDICSDIPQIMHLT